MKIGKFLHELGWKRLYAWLVVYGYFWQIVVWGPLFWLTTLLTAFTGQPWPAPPVLPWEHLLAATANLAVIGTVELFKDRAERGDSMGEGGTT
jgi:hypothetical protein